jgi:chaperonin cofactor prefoldin
MSKIVLTADADLIDNSARRWIQMIETKVETLNDRTKRQTLQIRELEKEIKEMKEVIIKMKGGQKQNGNTRELGNA